MARLLREIHAQQLDELSKKTLGSYVRKAFVDAGNNAADYGEKANQAATVADAERAYQKYHKRRKGVGKAIQKLTKEDLEELDELSRETLGSYIKKAKADAGLHASDYGHLVRKNTNGSAAHRALQQYKKRARGIDKAVDRLTKEDLDEAHVVGGSPDVPATGIYDNDNQVRVHRQDAAKYSDMAIYHHARRKEHENLSIYHGQKNNTVDADIHKEVAKLHRGLYKHYSNLAKSHTSKMHARLAELGENK